MGLLGKNKLFTGCLQGLMEMCKHFDGIFRGSAKGTVGELGQAWKI